MTAELAVDNDVLLKAISYGLERSFWPDTGDSEIGVLGAARYVIGNRLEKTKPGRADAKEALEELLGETEELEPDEAELDLAAEVERRAQELGLELDPGESQLTAMVVRREIAVLETGDKRAIAGLEPLVAEITELGALCGKVRCLEQIAHRLVGEQENFPRVASAICAETDVDKSLSVCFSCYSGMTAKQEAVLEALLEYIEDVRAMAPSNMSGQAVAMPRRGAVQR